MSEKRCPKCKIVKPLSEFYKCCYWLDGLTYHCKSCHKKQQASWWRNKQQKRSVARQQSIEDTIRFFEQWKAEGE